MSCDIMLRMITPGLATLASSALSCYAAKLEKLAVTAPESYDNRTKGFYFFSFSPSRSMRCMVFQPRVAHFTLAGM